MNAFDLVLFGRQTPLLTEYVNSDWPSRPFSLGGVRMVDLEDLLPKKEIVALEKWRAAHLRSCRENLDEKPCLVCTACGNLPYLIYHIGESMQDLAWAIWR